MVDCIDIKIDEGILVKDIQIRNVEPDTKDTVEVKTKHAQGSEQEYSELDDEHANTQTDSRKHTETKEPSRIV